MLVLNRHPGESIVISDNITVKVIEIKNKQVRLGIEAPHFISVHRHEIYEKIQVEKNSVKKE